MWSLWPGSHSLNRAPLGSLLKLRKISKSFYLRPVLREISLQIDAGETVFLAGRNGSGKTTLLKILAGIMRPEKGSGQLAGIPLFSADGSWRRNIAYLGHFPNLYPSFSARDNLKLVLQLREQIWNEEAFQAALDRFGLAGRDTDEVRTYSEGMLRRLGLIRLAISDWQIAYLDEPASALDIEGAEQPSLLISSWRAEGRAVFYTSHDIGWGVDLADRCLFLGKGIIADELRPSEVSAIENLLRDSH